MYQYINYNLNNILQILLLDQPDLLLCAISFILHTLCHLDSCDLKGSTIRHNMMTAVAVGPFSVGFPTWFPGD